MRFLLLALALMTTFTSTTNAGIFRQRTRTRTTTQATVCQPGQACYQVATTVTQTTTTDAGFLAWLNGYRARYGLRPVGWDQNLANEAAANSAAQSQRGLGHWYMGTARRQNSAMYGHDLGARWSGSPAHNAALLDPSITVIGLAGVGNFWTFNGK
jgi:uncharacterized protein YkwD